MLSRYLQQVAQFPRLTVEEERELGHRIRRDRDEAALSRLIESNLRFVVRCARRYQWPGASFLDLIHEGNLGLAEAARRFDPARNRSFRQSAVWWVRESMMHLMTDQAAALSVTASLMTGHDGVAPDIAADPVAAPLLTGAPMAGRLPTREGMGLFDWWSAEKLRHSAKLSSRLN